MLSRWYVLGKQNVMLLQCILTFSASLSMEAMTQTKDVFPPDTTTSVPLSESFFTVNVFLFVPVNLLMTEMNLFQSGFLDV